MLPGTSQMLSSAARRATSRHRRPPSGSACRTVLSASQGSHEPRRCCSGNTNIDVPGYCRTRICPAAEVLRRTDGVVLYESERQFFCHDLLDLEVIELRNGRQTGCSGRCGIELLEAPISIPA